MSIDTAVRRYPQAYCHDCEKGLSPCGSQKAAEEAQRAHRDTTRKSPNVPTEHSNVTVYDHPDDLKEVLS